MVHPTPALLKAIRSKNEAFATAQSAYLNYLKAKSSCKETDELVAEVVRTEALYQQAVKASREVLADVEYEVLV